MKNRPQDQTTDTCLPPPGASVYLMGICGTGMAALAGLLQKKGYAVRGSDSQAYPPMGDLLRRLGIPIALGYHEDNLVPRPDLVIIGNVIRSDNPEAVWVQAEGIPHLSFPQTLSSLCLEDRTSLVVAGTHGKTTTSTLLVSALSASGPEPGFMIGGVLQGYGTGFQLGQPPWFVLEGDEYDTAFFDKRPKFVHYRPRGVLLTSVEFDHADIYRDLEAVKAAFAGLADLIPPDGVLVACGDWPTVREVAGRARCPVIFYGEGADCDWRLLEHQTHADGTSLTASSPEGSKVRARIQLPGRHNALNSLGVLALCHAFGLNLETAAQGLAACPGVRRRQEVRGEAGGVTVIDDFAHHPSAVRETLPALRARYPGRRLIAVFEPRTNTSRRSVFQEIYPTAFDAADWILVREVPDPEKAPEGDRFDAHRLVADLRARGLAADCLPDAAAIVEHLRTRLMPGDVVAVLSNGAFEGLHDLLLDMLKERAA